MTHRPKHVIEYVLLRAVAALVTLLPYRVALTLAWGLARVAFHGVRFRRREAERRIREVFGDAMPSREVRRIAWQSLRSLFFSAIDIMRGPSLTWARFQTLGDYSRVFEIMRPYQAAGRGAVIAVPHMGSWEVGGTGMALAGMPVFSIAGKQRNPLFDQYLNAMRSRMGIPIYMRGASALRTIIVQLKKGGFMAILPDVRLREPGVKVRFLGKEANVAPGMALFARHAGVPIVPIVNLRHGWAHHEGVVFTPVEPDPKADKDADVQRMTQAIMDLFSDAIRRDPGQWFWYNKRWILDPVD